MKNFTQYIQEYHLSQINPYLQRDVPDMREPLDKQSITSSNDIIHVEFIYNDKTYKYNIKYKELDFGTSENIHWHVTKSEGLIKFDIHAQKSDTGRYNATIINMKVDVLKDNKKIKEIIPNCCIHSYEENNNLLNIDVRNI